METSIAGTVTAVAAPAWPQAPERQGSATDRQFFSPDPELRVGSVVHVQRIILKFPGKLGTWGFVLG